MAAVSRLRGDVVVDGVNSRIVTAVRILAALLVTVSLHGQTVFPIGTPKEPGPMSTSGFDVARVGGEGLAAWSVPGSGTSLARYDLAGKRIGEIMQIVGCDGPEVASDGHDALVLCSDDASDRAFRATATVRAFRVTAAGMSEGRVVAVDGGLRGLEWNGREYVALTRASTNAYVLTRLDRDGKPVSGTVHVPSGFFTALSLACGDTRCMIATFAPFQTSRLGAAVVNESDFPAIGSARSIRTFPLFDGNFIALGFNDLGFYSFTSQPAGLMLRRHGRLRGPFPERALRFGSSQPLVVQATAWPAFASNGGDIHVVAGPFHRITPAGVVETVVPAQNHYEPLGIVAAGSGTLLFWGDSSRVVHVTRVTESSFPDDSAFVSVGLPLEFMPRLARGHSTLLAAWMEGSPNGYGDVRDASLYYSMLDLEGRPLTAPVRLDDHPRADAAIAFDGVNFLIFWWSGTTGRFYGHLISQQGQLVGERIVLECYMPILTLVWSRNAYLTSCNGLQRIASSGTLLDRQPLYSSGAMLVRDEEQDLLRGLGFEIEHSDVSALTQVFATYNFARIDDRTLPFRVLEPGSGAFTPQVGVDQNALPAVAVGGGSEIAVFQGGAYDEGPLYLVGSSSPLPYPPPTPEFHKSRLHAHWSGREFIIVAGRTLARHAPDGTLLGTLSLGEDVGDAAAVGDGPDAVIVLRQRGDGHSIEAMRVNVPAN